MKIRSKLRAAGICLLTTALLATVTQAITQAPARASGPINVITSPPLNVAVQPPPLIVQKHDPVAGATPIVVDNPGGTSPTAQECIPLDTKNEIFCLGTSGDALYPSGVFLPPFKVTNGFTAPGDLPGDKMDWIIQEAYAVTADAHGVANDDLIKAYARPEIRAYVHTRLLDIINKKLYGKTMTLQENEAYEALEQQFQANQVKAAKAALYEYDLWSSSPCTYVPPTPPAGMPFVANPVIGTAGCSQANKYDLFKLTKGTPPAETFEKWASYRNPTALVDNANSPRVRYMIGKTQAATIAVGAIGAAAAAGAGIGIGVAATAAVAAMAAGAVTGEIGGVAATALSFGATAAAAGPAIIFAIAVIIIAVAISQMEADAAPGEQIRDRAARAASNTDPLGVRGRIADYSPLVLNFLTRPDPAGQDPAIVHSEAFTKGLEAQVAQWMMFDQGGDILDDPVVGYNVTESAPDDIHFAENGDSLPFVTVKAPAGALDRDGHPVSEYRVLFSRNWPMVAEHRSDNSIWSPYRARMSLEYVDQAGKIAQMSLLRHWEGNGAPKIDFNIVRSDAAPGEQNDYSPEWTFTKTGGGLRTVSLLPFDTTLRPVNVVPSVQGIMTADNTVKLSANLSTPGQSLPGSYAWVLERLNDDGTVAETIPVNAIASPSKRLVEPGRYRATAGYTVTGPPAFTRTGVIEFTMNPPEPEIGRSSGFNVDATIRDERVLNGSLFLDLRMLQATQDDDFTVKVDWADDGRGNVVSKTYTVHCEDTQSDVPSCDTGPMILPEAAPTNENWSESPSFRIPDDQDFLPQVTVKVTNGYGQVVTRSFPIIGDHRPTYETMTPKAEMVAGGDGLVNVVEVFPSPLLTDSQELTIFPYINSIAEQLPDGLVPALDKINGHWFLQIKGTPQADSIGTYVFYFPFEQEPLGSGLRPPPALASLEIKASSDPGYRSILRGTPTKFLDRQYRNKYPAYSVQVAEVLPSPAADFTPFQGVVKCKLVTGPRVVFDKVCANNKPFPWPAEKISDVMIASTYLESDTQQISADPAYSVDLFSKFVDPSVTQVAGTSLLAKFTMTLADQNIVLPPFAAKGYSVKCSRDGSAYVACLDNGKLSLPRVPGAHNLGVRVTAADGAVTTIKVPWVVSTPKTTFAVKAPDQRKKRGSKVVITASKLLPGEAYVIRIDGRKVASGKATMAGTVERRVTVPGKTKVGKVSVTVRGATSLRTGKDTLRVIK